MNARKRVISIDIMRACAVLFMEVGHTIGNEHFNIEDFVSSSWINVVILSPFILFANWKGIFALISGCTIGYKTFSKHHKVASSKSIRPNIVIELQSLVNSALVWIVLTLALWLSNVINDFHIAWTSDAVDQFWDHDFRIRAKSNPCGCFALLIPLVQTCTGVIHIVSRMISSKTKNDHPKHRLISRVWAMIVVLLSLSLLAGFVSPVVEEWITARWKVIAVENGYKAKHISSSASIAKAKWVVLNTDKYNPVSNYLHGLIASELTAPIMGLLPYAVNGFAGAAIGVWLGALGAASGEAEKKVRGSFTRLFMIPGALLVVGALWAIVGDNFKGFPLLEMVGLADDGEISTFHGGNYELLLCAAQVPLVLWFIWRCELKPGVDRTLMLSKTKWLRRFGSYSLTCFVYDEIYLGVVQWLASLYIPSCLDTEDGGLQECEGYLALVHYLVLGTAMTFLVLYLFDLVHGFLSMDWWLSAVGGGFRHMITPGKGKRGFRKLLSVLKPSIHLNHTNIQAIDLLDVEQLDDDDVEEEEPCTEVVIDRVDEGEQLEPLRASSTELC
eukprot:gnl/Dysnectes_brevis/2765_a3368_1366.p1 GENE.gnl/Dysnectes_brevis/2765_a3368_1366~~gnl/Dysnectes_brevis/2765_a3368_1366.p1  ORF type:complete len:567 (+),score=102.05 gnl/Dysnectes_brevis/2765_a3368_1366:30-1703(+)